MESPPVDSLLSRLSRTALRTVAYLSCAGALFVVVGCLIYPSWWYVFIWRGGFTHSYNYTAVLREMDRVPLQAVGVIIVATIAILILYIRRSSLNRFADNHGGISAVVAILVVVAAALLVNATQRKKWQLIVMA